MNTARKQTKVVTAIIVVIAVAAIAIGFMAGFIKEMQDAEYEQVYALQEVESIEKLSKKDKRLEEMGIVPSDNEVLYLANLLVENQDTEEINYLSFDAEDQDGNYIPCQSLDPYSNYDVGSRSVIPAGVSRSIPVVLTLYKESMEEVESISFYRWDSDGDEEKVCTISMDEIQEETE